MKSLDGEVHVHRLNLAGCPDTSFDQAWHLLDGEEQERAGRFRHEPTRRSFVLVRSALRVLLGHYLRRTPDSIQFLLGEKGKPRLAGTEPNQGLVFNVSHSGDWGLIALSRDTALGIDVERKRAMAHRDGMAERCFATEELAWWRALPDEGQGQSFFTFWCCKEAFLKATGEGITLGLETCVMDLSGQPRLVSIPQRCGKAEEWRLAEIEVEESYAAAVCYRGAERNLRLGEGAAFVNNLLKVADLL